ncbi:MAG: hypothetical protein WC449_06125 [Candidatus Paceibacterota bacterium]
MGTDLMVLIDKSGLSQTQKDLMAEKFGEAFKISKEWEEKSRTIRVVDANQTADMKMARVGRLFLREKRIVIEKTRKELVESSTRESQAINLIARTLKGLIEPIEEYLDQQEHFVELKAAREAAEQAERDRQAAEAKAEEDRIAKEKADAIERKRVLDENHRLWEEKQKADADAAEERRKAAVVKRESDEKIRQEKLKREEAERLQKKAEADRKAAVERTRVVQTQKNEEVKAVRQENIELKQQIKNMVKCPNCGFEINLPQA